VAGSRHGMCESAFNTASERHGMCESAFRVLTEEPSRSGSKVRPQDEHHDSAATSSTIVLSVRSEPTASSCVKPIPQTTDRFYETR
jgi:hypothetical protein